MKIERLNKANKYKGLFAYPVFYADKFWNAVFHVKILLYMKALLIAMIPKQLVFVWFSMVFVTPRSSQTLFYPLLEEGHDRVVFHHCTLSCCINFRKHDHIHAITTISQYLNGACIWNISPGKTQPYCKTQSIPWHQHRPSISSCGIGIQQQTD